MKALVRWIIGPVLKGGFEVLRVSCHEMKKVYGDHLDYLICHNQLSDKQRRRVESIGLPTYQQHESEGVATPSVWRGACGNSWKLAPPRLRPEAHEIIMDNDVVITSRIKTIDSFLGGNGVMLCEGLSRNYGVFDGMVPGPFALNSGIIGLPPGFDFGRRLREFLPPDWEWDGFFDEQGLVVASLIDYLPLIVRLSEVCILKPDDPLRPAQGLHFVGVNSNERHSAWDEFRRRAIFMM